MKATRVDQDGSVHCPNCNGTSFAMKRSVKGKITAGIAAPKRVHCMGCGANLKPGKGKPGKPTFAEIEQQIIARKAAKQATKNTHSTD